MKLHMHPISNTSRPVLLMIAEHDLPVELEVVDLMAGAHMQEPFASLNPSRMVPVLEEDGFVLTESAAIMKYLADRFGLDSVYPKELKARARVNEAMDWFNTNLYRELAYGLVYPQVFDHLKRPSEALQQGTIEWGRQGARRWLKVLNEHFLGGGKRFLCGDRLTIADYFGASLITCADLIGCDFSGYANVERWLAAMRGLKSWPKVNETFDGMRQSLAEKRFETV